MNKNYFLKIVLVCVLLFQFINKASAQYAVTGTAGPALTRSVYWLTWNPGASGLISYPTGVTNNEIVADPLVPYVWQYSPTVRIKAIVTNLVTTNGSKMGSYTPGTWVGDGLDVLYNGNGITTPKTGAPGGSLGVPNSGLVTAASQQVTFDIAITVEILINGAYQPVTYPGMVIADAEAIAYVPDPNDPNVPDPNATEYISGTTDGPTAWELLNLRVDPLKPGQTNVWGVPTDQHHYVMDLSSTGKNFKIYADKYSGHDAGVQAVMYANGAHSLSSVSMRGQGATALAVGFVLPFELGDALDTYGKPESYINSFDFTAAPIAPGNGIVLIDQTQATLIPKAKLYMGANNVDADGNNALDATATSDNLNGANDEDALTPAAISNLNIKVDKTTDVVVTIPSVTNNEGVPVYLYGWIDFNGDGKFSANERATRQTLSGVTNTGVQLTFHQSDFGSIIKAGNTFARFRVTQDNLTDYDLSTTEDEASISAASDGEIEDYALNIAGVTISGNVYHDGDGIANGISTTTTVSTVGSNALYAYLLDKGTGHILKRSPVTGGAYSFTDIDNGAYSVAISSVAPVTPGNTTSITNLAPALPTGWAASVDGFGTNNAANTAVPPAIADGTPDLLVDVTTPTGGLDVTGINFGLNQNPVAVDVTVSTNIDVAVSSVLPSSDTDPDGNTTIDATSITIENPAVPNTFATTGFTTTQGTYALNATTGKITFTPVTGFKGTTTAIRYKVKDAFGAQSLTPGNFIVVVSLGGVADTYTTKMNVAILNPVKTNDGTAANTVAPDPVASVTPTSPAHGTAVVDPITNIITYTPTTGFIGVDTYTYTLTKGSDVSAAINVTVTVLPNGTPDASSTAQDQVVNTPVNGNDLTQIDPTISGESIAIVSAPTHGAAAINGDFKSIDYTPILSGVSWIGTDSYTYSITKNGQTSAPILVSLTVKPKGTADNISTTQDQLINKLVNQNDLTQIDPTISGESIAIVSAPTHGTAAVNGDFKSIDYTPILSGVSWIGTDSYTYAITKNGQTSIPILVNVTVKPKGTTDNASTAQDQVVNTKVNQNDLTQIDPTISGESIAIVSVPTHGTAAINGDFKSIDYTPILSGVSWIGTDSYTYSITKNGQTSIPILVNVTVKPKGTTDNISTAQDQLINTLVNNNDLTQIDPAISGESIAIVSTPTHGTAAVNGDLKSIDYTPILSGVSWIGTDSYTYSITKNGQTSIPILVNVTVKPKGTNDDDNTVQDQPVNTLVNQNDLTQIDPTISGQSIAVLTGGPNAVVNANGKSIDYTPVSGFVGSAFYIYTITKNGQTSTGITVNIKVKPKGTDDADATTQGVAKNTTVLANDLTNTGVTIIPGTDPASGTLALVGGNSITYTPNATFVGVETYTYTLSKAGLTSAPITVSMAVKPKGSDDNDRTPLNTPVTTTVITNDGLTGATVTPTNGGHGTTSVSGGDVTYTPNNNYVGTDTYTYILTKNGQTSAPVTVTISVYNASMTLTKVANNGAQNAGDVINYTLIVKNTGNVDITNVVVADAGADAGSITPASIATLAAGASATLTAKHTVVAADVAAGQYSNQASVTGKDPKNLTVTKPKSDDPGTSTPDDPTVVPITPPTPPAGTITLTKTGAFAGNKVTYTFTIKNTGNTALNNITLTDAKLNLAAVSITAPAGGLQPGISVTYTSVYTLTQADKDAGKVDNTASVTATDINNNPVTNTGTATTTVPKSPVAVNDKGDVTGNTPLVISVLGNDDPGNSSFQLPSIEIVTGAQHGTAVANAAGTVTYTPTAGYVGPDVFTYRVKDQYGYYTNIATVNINALAQLVKVPSLFTPNGDGVNDGFVIKDLADYAQNELIVLNRWGNEVYRKENYQNNWSGTGLNEGTYFYIVKLKKANGDSWVIQKGYVTLIRQFKK